MRQLTKEESKVLVKAIVAKRKLIEQLKANLCPPEKVNEHMNELYNMLASLEGVEFSSDSNNTYCGMGDQRF